MKRRFRADDPDRKEWQDPEKILSTIGLEEGMTFIDVGCGEGYFALPAARRVGQDGKVYAFDINPDAVAGLREYAAAGGLTTTCPQRSGQRKKPSPAKAVPISSSSGSTSTISRTRYMCCRTQRRCSALPGGSSISTGTTSRWISARPRKSGSPLKKPGA